MADDGGGAHGLVVGSQIGKLIVVGDKPKPAIEALIVVGATGVEKHPLVPDDIFEELAIGESGAADTGIFDRGRIGEPDRVAVGADADVVLAVSRKGVGGAVESGRHDVADVRRDAVLEAFAEEPDLIPAGAVCKGVETVVEGPVVKSGTPQPWSRSGAVASALVCSTN